MSEKKRFLLRLDDRLYGALEKWAADDLRSVNAQIEFLLADALRRARRVKGVGLTGPEEGGSKSQDSPTE